MRHKSSKKCLPLVSVKSSVTVRLSPGHAIYLPVSHFKVPGSVCVVLPPNFFGNLSLEIIGSIRHARRYQTSSTDLGMLPNMEHLSCYAGENCSHLVCPMGSGGSSLSYCGTECQVLQRGTQPALHHPSHSRRRRLHVRPFSFCFGACACARGNKMPFNVFVAVSVMVRAVKCACLFCCVPLSLYL